MKVCVCERTRSNEREDEQDENGHGGKIGDDFTQYLRAFWITVSHLSFPLVLIPASSAGVL
jgi:hypothetical protein